MQHKDDYLCISTDHSSNLHPVYVLNSVSYNSPGSWDC